MVGPAYICFLNLLAVCCVIISSKEIVVSKSAWLVCAQLAQLIPVLCNATC